MQLAMKDEREEFTGTMAINKDSRNQLSRIIRKVIFLYMILTDSQVH